MVNNTNLYLKNNTNLTQPPDLKDADLRDRRIQDTPIWDLNELKNLVSQDSFKIVTNKAIQNYEVLLENGFNLSDTLNSINAARDFKGAYWCKTSPSIDKQGKPRGLGVWIPCDSYSVNCKFENPTNGFIGSVSYYLKMCKDLNGNTVLFVSIHV